MPVLMFGKGNSAASRLLSRQQRLRGKRRLLADFEAAFTLVTQRTEANRAPAANGRHPAPGRAGEPQELLDHLEDQGCPIHDSQFVTEPLKVRVDRVRGDSEISGDGELGAVVEHTADDLQLAFGEPQAASNFGPSAVRENLGAGMALAAGASRSLGRTRRRSFFGVGG